ncbi:uncharacterized protein BDV14DRAFT_169361 [Aspergillus stella-maris]|uniref:uncharacterized protein n=1 Tax=Aspergillus stella-maris TaxID=1810926 RepID=UPI003CCCB888
MNHHENVSAEYLAESRVTELYVGYSVPIPCIIVSTGLRLWAESRLHRHLLAFDDWLMVAATCVSVALCAVAIALGPVKGLGRHGAALKEESFRAIHIGNYAIGHLYQFALALTKFPVLALYYRALLSKAMRRVVIGTTTLIIMWLLGMEVLLIINYRDLRATWEAAAHEKFANDPGCTSSYFNNIFNMILDIWIFVMPIPVVSKLKLPLEKKLGLGFLFSIGLATCSISATRIAYIEASCDDDSTWTIVPFFILSMWEPLGGILCANLPITYKPLATCLGSRKKDASSGAATPEGSPHSWYYFHRKMQRQRRQRSLHPELESTGWTGYTRTTSSERILLEPMDAGNLLVSESRDKAAKTFDDRGGAANV